LLQSDTLPGPFSICPCIQIEYPEDMERERHHVQRSPQPPEEVLSDSLRQNRPAPDASPSKVANGESLCDKLARKGLIGCLSGGPPDLSTNPKYMEGFGE